LARLERRAILNGAFQENCWLLADRERGEAVLVDPGEEADRFLAELARDQLTLTAIWLTHAHIDHALGVGPVVEATGAPIYLHPDDRPLYDAMPQQALAWLGVRLAPLPEPTHALAHGDELVFAGSTFTVRHVPGHAPGHVAFVTEGWVLGGDVLFAGSVGRVDLPGGDGPALMRSIERHFLTLPDDTVVCPGHGPETTIGRERATNPFLTGAARIV
jgi:glyoxylase-like metal-dependent hydrolase (beta-lactamase superfamily II)